jgi:hypothetical protein
LELEINDSFFHRKELLGWLQEVRSVERDVAKPRATAQVPIQATHANTVQKLYAISCYKYKPLLKPGFTGVKSFLKRINQTALIDSF